MLATIPLNEKFFCTSSAKKRYRAKREDEETVFVYAPGKKRYGWRMSNSAFLSVYTPCTYKAQDENAKWHKRIDRAIKCLETSGIWPDKLEYFKTLSIMNWDDHQAMNTLYWSMPYPRDFDTPEWNEWFEKYPFLKVVVADSTFYPATEYLWEGSEVKLKSMYFGKYFNQRYKNDIKNAMERRSRLSIPRVKANYDVSFEYDPERNMAWYSEEYRNCGNGYYYLALDHNTAWFIEKD